ncbi:hypothetical protein BDV10DRAFT_153972 [Aspergillus recurvatus]
MDQRPDSSVTGPTSPRPTTSETTVILKPRPRRPEYADPCTSSHNLTPTYVRQSTAALSFNF